MEFSELIRSSLLAIRTNKVRSFLTTLGIIIGVASVILLVSIGTGLQEYITKEFESMGSNVLYISPGRVSFSGGGPPSNGEAKFDFDDVKNLGNLGSPITKASGMINKGLTVKYQAKSFYGSIAGVEADYVEFGNVKLEQGKFFTSSDVERGKAVVVIGHKVYTELFGDGREVIGKDIDISGRQVKVVGLLEEKGGSLGGGGENNYVMMPVTSASKILGIKKPAAIMVRISTADEAAVATKKVKNYFYRRKLTDDDFTVMEPKELLNSINSVLGVVTGALSGIAAISLVVGGIGIANIMLVSVTERTREIGLRKALGATNRDILAQFLMEAVILSALGGGMGIAIGAGLSWIMKSFIQTAVTAGTVGLAFGISAAVGIIAGFTPALRASKLNPIEALRWE